MMMKLLLLLIGSILGASAQDTSLIQDIICPLPGNPSPATVTAQDCSPYTACEFTNNVCHMKKNNEAGYTVTSGPIDTGTGFTMSLQKAVPGNTLFGADIQNLTLLVMYHGDAYLHFKIYDSANARYEVPYSLNMNMDTPVNPLYQVTTTAVGEPFTLNVTRVATGVNVLKLSGPLTFEDQFLQVTHQLPSSYVYGIGENSQNSLRRDFSTRQTYPIFARDQPITYSSPTLNLYGTHPYYVNVEDDAGNTHSVLLYNSNAMEFSTFSLGANPAITIRSTGGILDFHLFMGPTPEDVNVQYSDTVGHSVFPPYWAFGFHLARWGYNTLENYRLVYDRMIAAQIPWDTQTFDIDYMDQYRDFTFDQMAFAGFPQLIQELHDNNMKVVLIQDPAIVADWDNYPPAQNGKNSDVFIKWTNPADIPTDQPAGAGDYVVGYVWPNNKTVFPDFLSNATRDWWSSEYQTFHNVTNFDGIWIDMNEPANFGTNLDRPWNYPPGEPDWSLKCPSNTLDDPPYGTLVTFEVENESQRLSDKTICMSTTQTNGVDSFSHYDVHNLYGYSEAIATHHTLTRVLFPAKRPFLLSRSTFPGSGQYTAHWLGDNTADWQNLRISIIGIINFNLFAIPFVGADVCGFLGEPTEELCIRWMQAGAFYPFDRNHNTNGTADQDPARPGWDLSPVISRDILLLRYKYLPSLYTVFHEAHHNGNSVIRPLFNVFPTDLFGRDVQDQFLWGEALMVTPVVYEGATSRDVYFPDGYWYDLTTGTLTASAAGTIHIQAPLDKLPIYVRGGFVLPYQEPALTTVDSRLNPLGITVALDASGSATGVLFWDDGVSEHLLTHDSSYEGTFTFAQNSLTLVVANNPTVVAGLDLGTISIYGFPFNPSEIDVNAVPADPATWTFDATNNILTFFPSIPIDTAFIIDFIN